MPITGSSPTIVAHDEERGSTWVVDETALFLGDEARYKDYARRFPDFYSISYMAGGTPQLLRRTVLIGSPSASFTKKGKRINYFKA
jgi:hypothetical protein